MHVRRSFFTLVLVSFTFIGLIVLGIPVSGFAQPHPCTKDASGNLVGHLNLSPTGLGGATSTFTFLFAKNCPTSTSSAISLKWAVTRYSDGTSLCSGGPVDLKSTSSPPYTISFTCNPAAPGFPTGAWPQVKVVLSYQTSVGGSWMNHPDIFANQR